jgi:hypothetical protein
MECKESRSTIFVKYPAIISLIYQREKVQYFNKKYAITLVRVEKGQQVDWARIIFNSLCSELDRWYKYVKENKGNKKYTCQSTLVLEKSFNICLCIKRTIHRNHRPRLKELGRRCIQH